MELDDNVKDKSNNRFLYHWWRRCTAVEKILFVSIFVLILFCFGTIIAIILLTTKINTPNDNDRKVFTYVTGQGQEMCLSQGCIKSAAQFINSMDTNIDPCDDFYYFSCGNWLKETMIPEDESKTNHYDHLTKEVEYKLKELIENVKDDAPPFIRNVKAFYTACINITEIDRLKSEPIKSVVQKLGGWKVVEDRTDYFNPIETMKTIQKLGLDFNIFFSFKVMVDLKNATRHILALDQPELGLSETYLLNGLDDEIVSAYYELMVSSAVLLGASSDKAKREMKEVLLLEIELAKLFLTEEDADNITLLYNKMTVRALQNISPRIEWYSYINNMLSNVQNNHFSLNDEIVVTNVKYIEKLSEILTRSDRARKRTIANYMIWRVVRDSIPYLSKEWRSSYLIFKAALYGSTRAPDRSLFCVQEAAEELTKAVDSMYVQTYVSSEKREQVQLMTKYIKEAFLENLGKLNWLDSNTLTKAKSKINEMVFHIGYPDEILDHKLLSEYYANLHLDSSAYYENHKNIIKWVVKTNFADLRKPFDKKHWKNGAQIAVANAFYNPNTNSLEIPGGYLDGIFFDAERPNYINFGAAGNTIGHEFSHGFDARGLQIDAAAGHKVLSEEAEKVFKTQTECMISQYGNYSYPELSMTVNGKTTLSENIADNTGLKLAYTAYKMWLKEHEEEPILPGLKYTQKQLFWISSAIAECTKETTEYLKLALLTDPHAPAYFRVVGMISNSKEFSKDFNCPLGSKMNPWNKCDIW